jgi:hypothetical protein
MASRWARALRFIAREISHVSEFRQCLADHGGIAGCARQFAKGRRRPTRSSRRPLINSDQGCRVGAIMGPKAPSASQPRSRISWVGGGPSVNGSNPGFLGELSEKGGTR